MQEMQVRSLGRENPLEKKWQHTPVFLSGKSQGQKSLAGYSTQGPKRFGHDLTTNNNKHVSYGYHKRITAS